MFNNSYFYFDNLKFFCYNAVNKGSFMGFIHNITIKKEFKKSSTKAEELYELSRVGIKEANQIYWNYNLSALHHMDYVNLKKLDIAIDDSIVNIKHLKSTIAHIKEMYKNNPKLFTKFYNEYSKTISYLDKLLKETIQLSADIKNSEYYNRANDLIHTIQQLEKIKKVLQTDAKAKDAKLTQTEFSI